MSYARDVYEEGPLIFPCVRIQRDYEDVVDIVRMCQSRIRVPEMWYGDYLAAVGAVRIGERRLQELADRYGRETLEQFVDEWLDYSERRMTEAIRELPSSKLRVSGCHDPLEGHEDGIPVNAAIEIDSEAGRIEVDLRDNDDCQPLGLNLSEACARRGDDRDLQLPTRRRSPQRGKLPPRRDIDPGGLSGGRPHPSALGIGLDDERLEPADQRNPVRVRPARRRPRPRRGGGRLRPGIRGVLRGGSATGVPYVNQLVLGNNGGPGTPVCDGWITYAMPDCAKTIYIDSIEVLEQKYPIHFRSLRLLPDSGGAGKFRGAPEARSCSAPREARCRRSTSPTSAITRRSGCSGAPTDRSRPSRRSTATGRRRRSRRSAMSSWKRASAFEAWNRAAAATGIRSSAIQRPCDATCSMAGSLPPPPGMTTAWS